MEQNIRTLAAAILSMLIIFGWQYFFVSEELEHHFEDEAIEEERNEEEQQETTQELNAQPRVTFSNSYVSGSIQLIGAQIDNLVLRKYQDKNGNDMVLLAPEFSSEPSFIRVNFTVGKHEQNAIDLPNSKTLWTLDEQNDERKISMHWISSQNIVFRVKLELDDMYMFKVKTEVDATNAVINNVKIRSQVSIQRSRNASIADSMILHEGAVSVMNGKLKEIGFSDIQKEKFSYNDNVNWIGFSDKYWLVSVIPSEKVSGVISKGFYESWNQEKFSIDLLTPIKNDKVISTSFMIFAGAKSIEVLDHYAKVYNISMFDRAVDLGFLYFITKPIFLILNYFYKMLGNFGLAIMLLTIITKVLLFPLAYKSVKSMNKIRILQPKIQKLKDQYSGNTMLFQQALVSLYKKEKVNPASGCLPIFLQMPIFFALYKVLYVTIEMRNAPFFLWINDLSAPDTTTVFNLFGLIPWQPPMFLMIGVLPILMSLTMFVQQMLSPQPTDVTQAMMMKLMPFILLVMFAQFPSGLLLYWTWSNIISIAQQIVIRYLPE